METRSELEFVNREDELAYLVDWLRSPHLTPPVIIIRSPPGFGKSRLTDHLSQRTDFRDQRFCIVDPSIRTGVDVLRVYDGFFLQRSAEALSTLANSYQGQWPTFAAFLHTRRWKTTTEKQTLEAFSEMPTSSSLYKIALDYAARLWGFGRYSARELLHSDRFEAVKACSEYVQYVLKHFPIVLIVRETQHLDMESLRTLLRLNQFELTPPLILEYTSETNEFGPDHQKLLIRVAETHTNINILDLTRLSLEHLTYLIRRNVRADLALNSDYYLTWSGNLRSIIELRFRVAIGQHRVNAVDMVNVLTSLNRSLESHLAQLSSIQHLLLAIVAANIEALDKQSLSRVFAEIRPAIPQNALNMAIRELIEVHGFLSKSDGSYRIQSDTVSTALAGAPFFRPIIALAERSLREHYAMAIETASYDRIGLSAAVRQVFRLCARTKDATGLLRAVDILALEVKRSQDQSMYVDSVVSALESDPQLYAHDHDELVTWAASLAYDVCEWERAANLLYLKQTQDSFSQAMRACALQEIGRHDEALALAPIIRANATHSDQRLIADLIESIIGGCRGEHEFARRNLKKIILTSEYQTSPLLGYAYRFFEVVQGYAECADSLNRSIDWFEKFGFVKSRAYSQLPLAVIAARLGQIEAGRRLILEAERALVNEVRDQHMVLNNGAAVELLDATPDFRDCKKKLLAALLLVRDDYSELTVLSNLGLAYWGLQDMDAALACVEKVLLILQDHDFADKDVYWPACFNAAQILGAMGLKERQQRVLRFPRDQGRPSSVNRSYWAYRYGDSAELGEEYIILASRPRHPLYLSHWIVDLDGLNLLRRVRLQ
jgi:hypothetical protein